MLLHFLLELCYIIYTVGGWIESVYLARTSTVLLTAVMNTKFNMFYHKRLCNSLKRMFCLIVCYKKLHLTYIQRL